MASTETAAEAQSASPSVQSANAQPENPFASLVLDQQVTYIPTFTLESGEVLYNAPVAYTTRGKLSEGRDNVLLICHALSGSADVADWWGPLMGGPGRAFDLTRFFVICLNSLGSPYGSASPVTSKNGDPSLGRYGPEFPLTTIRDDVNIHKLVLDQLGVRQIACVVGGSMGGMLTLEYAFFGTDYVRAIAPIATSATHSAWGISWGEAQRQSIYSDPKYEDGYYAFDDPPTAGLGAARMSALLTYRSRDSFEARFGRNVPDLSKKQSINQVNGTQDGQNEHWTIHNDGNKRAKGSRDSRPASRNGRISEPSSQPDSPRRPLFSPEHDHPGGTFQDPQFTGATEFPVPVPPTLTRRTSRPTHYYYSAQSYLRYQGTKFVTRFDANCYIAITRKLDTHDISRNRAKTVKDALATIQQPTLVLGIESDGLFTIAEQEEIANGIPGARLGKIDSPEGHDAFLLQFEQVNSYLLAFFREVLPDIMGKPGINPVEGEDGAHVTDGVGEMTKSSTFGEAEVGDLTAW